jgi:hypothetical protein
MYQEYLMHARHEDRLRTAAKHQLAAQARQGPPGTRHQTELNPVRRLMRQLPRLARASWNLYVTSTTGVFSPCGSTYTATTDFTLVSDPGSTLVLDEGGSLCGLGHDGAAYRGYFNEGSKAFGHPFDIVSSWAVDPASTGQFLGLTGSGTNLVLVAGAHAAGTYSGTLG